MMEYDVDENGERECQILITIPEEEITALEWATGCEGSDYDGVYNSVCQLLGDLEKKYQDSPEAQEKREAKRKEENHSVTMEFHVVSNESAYAEVEMTEKEAERIKNGENPEDVLPDYEWFAIMDEALANVEANGKMTAGFRGNQYVIDRWT